MWCPRVRSTAHQFCRAGKSCSFFHVVIYKYTEREPCYQRVKCNLRQRDITPRIDTIIWLWERESNGPLNKNWRNTASIQNIWPVPNTTDVAQWLSVREHRSLGCIQYSGKFFFFPVLGRHNFCISEQLWGIKLLNFSCINFLSCCLSFV